MKRDRTKVLTKLQGLRKRHVLSVELLENRALMAADSCVDDPMRAILASFAEQESHAVSSEDSNSIAFSSVVLSETTSTAIPVPLAARNPLGSLVYDTTVSGTIAAASDVSNFTINVDAGQKISLYLDPAATLKGLVRLYDSSNNLLGSATNAIGLDAVVQTISTLSVADTYRIEVSSDGAATTGSYTLGLVLNAHEESELHNGLSNDAVATAEDINGSFIPLSTAVSRGAVLGNATGSDFFQFNVNAGETVSLAAQSLSGGTINVALFDPAGIQLAGAIAGPTNLSRALSSFVAPAGGSYRARVTAVTAGTSYSLVVLKNGDFDRESNNATATAQPLVGSQGVLGAITSAGTDEDWYSISVNAGDSLDIRSSTPADGAGEFVNALNPKLELYDPSGVLVASGTALTDGRNEQVIHAATASGRYQVRVLGESNSTGEYFVSLAGNTGTSRPAFQATTTNPANGGRVLSVPSVYTVDFNDTLLASSLQASDLKINGINATSVSFVDGDTALFILPSGLGTGTHTITIDAGAILDTQNTPVEAFTATFSVDTVAPRVTATSVASNAAVAPGALSYSVTFSEPMKVANLTADDFILHGNLRQAVGVNYPPSSFSFNAAGTVLTINYASLPDDEYVLTLVAGTTSGTFFTDVAGLALDGEFSGSLPSGNGTAGGNFVTSFVMDTTSEAFPSLSPRNPLGSLVYNGSLVRTITSAGDVDEFTLNVDPNQTISVVVTPTTATTSAPGLQPRIEIFSPSNVSLGVENAAAPGGIVGLQAIPTNVGGTYRIAVSGLVGTRGGYSIEVTQNAAFEREDLVAGNASNNTPATAENIDSAFTNLSTAQATARRAAVIGVSDISSNPLPTEVEPNNTQATSSIAIANFVPTSGNLYHLGIKGDNSATTDIDFFNIGTLHVGDVLSATVSGSPSSRGANTDTFFRLFRGTPASPILVASNDDNGPGLDALLSGLTIFTTDTYYIQVDPGVKARTGTYDVALYLEDDGTAPLTGGTFVNESESNNTAATANNASTSWRAVQYLSRTEGIVSATTDIDFYRYQLTAGDLVTVTIDSQSALDARVNLRNAAGAIIASEDGTSVGPGTDSSIYSYIVPSSGAYFVEVLSATGTGAYNIDVLLSSNNTPPSASIGEDFYAFTANAGESLSLVLTNLSAGNVDLQLIGTDGTTVLAGGTGGATNLNESISRVVASTTGTYYARVTGTGGVSYNLDVLKNARFDKEPNNNFASAQTVFGSQGILGAITPALGSGLNATDSGYYFSDGQHPASENSYVLGQAQDGAGGLITVRNYFTFSLPSATSTIVGAELRLLTSVPPNQGYLSPDPSETYTLYDVSATPTAIDTNRGPADSIGLSIYSDLGSGTVFGSRNVTAADDATSISIPLNAAAVAALNAAIGSSFSIGGAITTLAGLDNQLLFLSTTGAAGQAQLVLETAVEGDWYSFGVNASDALVIESSTPGDGPGEFANGLNPQVELYDPSGTLVASGSALADARNARLLHTAAVTGTYRVRVFGEANTFGQYFVSVTGNTSTVSSPFLVTTTSPTNGAQLLVEPTTYTVNFNESVLPSSLQASDLLVNGIEATAVTLVDGDTASFTLPTGLGDGTHTVTIAAGAILNIQNTAVQAFSANYVLDTVVPTVLATSVAPNAVLAPGSLSYTVTFSEPMKVSNILFSGDFSLHGNFRQAAGVNYFPTSFSFNTAGTELTLNYTDLPDDDYTLTLIAGTNGGTNFTDAAGNALDGEFLGSFPTGNGAAGGNFIIGFDMDLATEAYAALNAKNPLGSLIYDASLSRTIGSVGDVDEFTLNVDPNQTITIVVTPTSASTSAPTLQGRIELFDPANTSLATASAVGAGAAVMIQSQPTTTGGTYRIAISGLGTVGAYTIDVILNAAVEQEGRVVGVNNNSIATAQNINDSFVDIGTTLAPAERGAVLGATDSLAYVVSAVAPSLVDISTTGTRSTTAINDDATDTLQVSQLNGFTFPFFGATYDTVSFNTNALITFGGASFEYSNTDLSTSPQEAAIAVLWDDLNIDNTGTGTASRAIFWQVIGTGADQQLVIQWNNVRRLSGTIYFTVQAVLSKDGSIQFNYAPTLAASEVTSATVGIKAAGTSNPLRQLIHFNQAAGPLVGPNLSTRITALSTLADYYRFDAVAGESVTLGLKDLAPGNLDLRLWGTDGTTLLASGIAGSSNLNEAISKFSIPSTGTYYASVQGLANVPYSLVVTKNADFDLENNSSLPTAQSLNGTKGVLGHVRASTAITTLFDFETGNQGFAVDNGTTGLWHRTTHRGLDTGHSALNSFHYGREGGTYNSGQRNSGSIVSPVISLPTIGALPFSFNYILQTETSQFVDTASVQVSTDDFATFTTIASRDTNLPNSADWREFTASLSAFAGQNVRIRFSFDTINAVNNAFAGWFVDDVRIGIAGEDDWYSVSVSTPGEQIHLETRTPSDGAGEFRNGLNPRIELYRPDGTLLTSGTVLADSRNELILINAPVAGTYHVRVTSEGFESGEYFLASNVNTALSTVASVIVSGSNWNDAFIDSVDGGGSGAGNGIGYELVPGMTVPNAGIDRIYIQFHQPVVGFNADNVAVLGINVADYADRMTVAYDSVNMRGIITLSESISNDNLRVGLSSSITDASLNSFDDDSNASTGSILDFRFNVSIGDASNDGVVNNLDLPGFAVAFNSTIGSPRYNARADWNADGIVNGADMPLYALWFNRAPLAEPMALDFSPPQSSETESEASESMLEPIAEDVDVYFSEWDDEDEMLSLDDFVYHE